MFGAYVRADKLVFDVDRVRNIAGEGNSLSALAELVPVGGAGEECKAGIDEGVHVARPASLRTAVSGNPARCQARPKIK